MRKIEAENLSTSFVGEGSKTKTFKHLEIFPSLGCQCFMETCTGDLAKASTKNLINKGREIQYGRMRKHIHTNPMR
jgi:hypothetical protein